MFQIFFITNPVFFEQVFKLKIAFLYIVTNVFKIIKERFGLICVLISGIKQVDKSSGWIDFAGIPCRNVKQKTALFSQFYKTFKLACQLQGFVQTSCFVVCLVFKNQIIEFIYQFLL